MPDGDHSSDHTGSEAERWASAYEGEIVDTPVDPALSAFGQARRPGRALDLGCGVGQHSIWLARRGWQVTAIDIVPRAIEVARGRALDAGVEVDFRIADVTTFEPSHDFDLVLSTYALPPAGRGRDDALAMASAAVAPGGTILICEFDASAAADGSLDRDDLVTLDELTAAMRGLDVETAEVKVARHRHGAAERQVAIAVVSASRADTEPAAA